MCLRNKIDAYGLPIAMVIGGIGYPFFHLLHDLLPISLFFMLFFTFLKVSPRQIRFYPWHGIALLIQTFLTIGVYFLLVWLLPLCGLSPEQTHIIAVGTMLCCLIPTATAAPIVTTKLGGTIGSLTTYTLITNLLITIIVPIIFPLLNTNNTLPLTTFALVLLYHIAPLLIGPLLLAWLIRLCMCHHKTTYNRLTIQCIPIPFYIWMFNLTILMGDMVYSLVNTHYTLSTVVILVGLSIVVCVIQFALGRSLGHHFPEKDNPQTYIPSSQALGQKNTTFGIWLAYSFLDSPLIALGTTAYIIWQNLYNAWEIKRHIGQ